MRTCASCGKANEPTRKYCVRCGKSLLTSRVDESTKTPVRSTERLERAEAARPRIEPETPRKQIAEAPKVATDDEWVRPSEVPRDRMRTTLGSKGKSEMEKAKEAFARAEQVGIQEEGGDIVETRMLRASDVRELMQEMAAQPQVPQRPVEIGSSQPVQRPAPMPREPPIVMANKTTQVETTKEHLGIQPASMTIGTSLRKSEPPRMASIADEPPFSLDRPTSTMQQPPQGRSPLQGSANSLANEPLTRSSVGKIHDAPIPEMDAIRACITQPEDLLDSKIKDSITELTNLHREKQQVLADQVAFSTQLEARVRESQNKSEVKKLQYESISEQMRLAKQEWDDAKEEFEKVENRRKRELASLDERVKNIQKRIEKAEGTVKKRVSELNKVREKIVQLQKQNTP